MPRSGDTLGGSGPVRPVGGPVLDGAGYSATRRRVGLTWGVGLSVFAHVSVFGGAWLYANMSPPRLVQEKPIVAKLVRLGTPRDEKLLPRLPKTAPPPKPAPAKPVSVATPAPAPTSAPAPPSPTAKAEPVAKPDPVADAAARRQQMMDALAKLAPATGATSDSGDEELPGQTDGHALGTAEDAEEGDRYLGLVVEAIRKNYVLPTTISARERLHLSCVLELKIAASGKIDSFRILETSGNPHFDRAVEASVRQTFLPAPPEGFRKAYGGGLEIRFKP